ncbi:MAG TPA: sodium ABC transporter ATP-binding protein [Pelotomaculum sp.]|nr:sodium ABC transporter ATP-binding protein [Pelotomaculum sp.]
MNNVLEVSGLNKSYGTFQLKDVNFTLPENCITGFIGINGAGKTTTIKSILGLVPKDSGTVKAFGKDMGKYEREIKNRIGIVLDEGAFYEELTMSEMKSIVAPAYSRWNENEYRSCMERFDLNPQQKISTLSKGMRMKFSLVLALSHEADLLIMDEPTSGLDPLIRNQFMNILLEFMKKEGKSVFFSTHITSDLDKVADMIILINDGQIVFEEEKDALLDTYKIVKGNPQELFDKTRKLFLSIQETEYSFTGITKNAVEIKSACKNILTEKPAIEDIMLGFIGGK